MKVLVYGFYNGKRNLGDNFFQEAYQALFPELDFLFTDRLNENLLLQSDVIFFGGGSFLDGEINVDKSLVENLKNKKIFYLGVGAETEIHPWHKYLLQKAKFIAVRNDKSIDRVKQINKNVLLCKDLVYCLSDQVIKKSRTDKSVLFIPNAHVISKWNSEAWKTSGWEFFKSELSQSFETLISKGYKIDVLPMCENKKHKDTFVAIEVFNKMVFGNISFLPFEEYDFKSLASIISQYQVVLSQRYHGSIVSDMVDTPCVNIHHHDKLRHFSAPLNINIDFYGASKSSLLCGIDKACTLTREECFDTRDLETLKNSVNKLLSE